MSLVYECGQGLVPTFLAKANSEIDAYLFCSGPSLLDLEFDSFRDKPIYKVGINTTYPRVKPDLWVGMDEPRCFNDNLWTEPFPKILRYQFNHHKVGKTPVRNFPFVYFAEIDEKITRNAPRELFNRRAHKTKFIWTNNTLTVSFHLLIWMGFKRIHLLGLDLGVGEDYYDDSIESRPFNHDPTSPSGKISDKQRGKNKRLYNQQIKFIKQFCEFGQKMGVELISCTKASPVNAFLDYKDPLTAVKQSEERMQKLKVNF